MALAHKNNPVINEAIPIKEGRCRPDPSVRAIAKKWRKRAGKKFDEIIGYSLSDFTSSDTGESSVGDLIADSMRQATGAEIAFINSFGIRNPLLKGEITYRDTYKALPFDNTLYTMLLTGRQVREILEQGLSLCSLALQPSQTPELTEVIGEPALVRDFTTDRYGFLEVGPCCGEVPSQPQHASEIVEYTCQKAPVALLAKEVYDFLEQRLGF